MSAQLHWGLLRDRRRRVRHQVRALNEFLKLSGSKVVARLGLRYVKMEQLVQIRMEVMPAFA
jgi:hypothetical protein